MNNPEKTQPQLAQESEEVSPAMFQKRFVILDEEKLEEIVGGGACCSRPMTPPLPPSPLVASGTSTRQRPDPTSEDPANFPRPVRT
jgi:hypothetical protein